MKKRRHWSRNDLLRLKNMQKRGCTAEEISQATGRSVDAVRNKLRSLGVRHHKNTNWRQCEIDEMIRLHRLGYSQGAIADRIGRSKNSVAGRMFRMGLCAERPVPEPKADDPVPVKIDPARGRHEGGKQDFGVGKWLKSLPRFAKPELSRTRTCQWMDEDPVHRGCSDHLKCGSPALMGSSYCEEHHEQSIDRRLTEESARSARNRRFRSTGFTGRVGSTEYSLGNADDRLGSIEAAS